MAAWVMKKDFVYVDMENLQTTKDFDHWINPFPLSLIKEVLKII